MADPTPVLSYATPTRSHGWWHRLRHGAVGRDRSLAVAQLVFAIAALAIVVWLFGPYGYSAGAWPTRLAWAWLPFGATALNAAAAGFAFSGTISGGRSARSYRRYVGLTVGNLVLTLAALAGVARWPSYVIIAPDAPPVNDRLYVFSADLYVKGPAWLLVLNPFLFLLFARGIVTSLRNGPPDATVE